MTDELCASGIRLRRRGSFSLQIDGIAFSQGLSLVVGPNGSGKSTLLECLTGAHWRHVDTLQILGMDPRVRNGIQYAALGYVPQLLLLPGRWTVRDYLTYAGWLKAMKTSALESRIDAASERLEISCHLDSRISKLSGGNKRRVLIAQSLLNRPKILIMDEPFAGLDASGVSIVRDLLLARAANATVLVADHTQTLLGDADRILRIEDGRIGE